MTYVHIPPPSPSPSHTYAPSLQGSTSDSTPLTEQDSANLDKLLLENNIRDFTLIGDRTYENIAQHLRELGHDKLAANLRSHT